VKPDFFLPENQFFTMKKNFLLTVLLAAALFSQTACKKDDPVNANRCEAEIKTYQDALLAWTNDLNSTTKCEAVKKSLTVLVNNCPGISNEERKQYQESLKDFTCK
jgi:hypothetical protein